MTIILATVNSVQAGLCVPYTDANEGIVTVNVPRQSPLFHALEGGPAPDPAVIYTASITASNTTPGKNAVITLNNKHSGKGQVKHQLYYYELLPNVASKPIFKYYLYFTDSCDIEVEIPGLNFQTGTMTVKVHQLTRTID